MACAVLLCGGAWAAVGDTITISNINKGTSRSVANFAGDTYSICLPPSLSLPAGSVVRVSKITLGMNSVSDADKLPKYLKIGETYSAIVNGTGSQNTASTFETNALKQEFDFTDKELDLTVGTEYALSMCSDEEGTVLSPTRWHLEQTTDANFSVIRQSTSVTAYRIDQEFVGVVRSVPEGRVMDFIFTGNATTGALEGDRSWVSGLLAAGNEGGDQVAKMYGPNGIVNMGYDSSNGNISSGKWHPWYGAASKNAFTIAAYLNLECVRAAEGKHAVLISLGNNAGRKIVLAKEPDGSVALIAANAGTVLNADTMPVLAASAVATGWHLYTFTFSTEEGLTLALDDGDPVVDASDEAKVATPTGFQIGSIYQGRPNNFTMPDYLGVAMVCGMPSLINAAGRADLTSRYSAVTGGEISADIHQDTADKELVLVSMSATGNQFIGVSKGALTIPAPAEVSVPHVRCVNNNATADRAVLNVAGTLNVTSESDNPNVWADRLNYKGVLFGHYHGQGTYNITGTLNAPGTYVEICYTAEAQTLNVNGGTLVAKGVYSFNGQGTVNLSNNGRIALSTSTFLNVPVTSAGGTIAAAETADYAKQLTVSSGDLALEVAEEKTLSFNGAVSNAGTITVKSGTVVLPAGSEGAVTVEAGAVLKLKVTDAQRTTGYTATDVTLPEGENVIFVFSDGTEQTGDGTRLPTTSPVWTGAAGDSNWDTDGNWSTGAAPTADTAATIDTEATITLSDTSVAKMVYVNADATFTGSLGTNLKDVTIVENKTLTLENEGNATICGITGGTLVKNGSGILTLTRSATTGKTLKDVSFAINAGKIFLNDADIDNVAFTVAAAACTEGACPIDCYGWVVASGNWSVTANGDMVLLNNTGNNPAVVTGAGSFTKRGTGTVTMTGSFGNSVNANNNYTGAVSVEQGTLRIAPRLVGDNFKSHVTGKLTVAAGAALELDGDAKFVHNGASNTADVLGTVTVAGGVVEMRGSDRGMRGDLNIAKGATLKVMRGDFFSYNQGQCGTVNVYGALDLGTYRQTLRNEWTFNFYSGCTVSGFGDDNVNWPCAMQFWAGNHTTSIRFRKSAEDETGLVTFNATLGLENGTTFDVEEGVTVVCGPAVSEETTRGLVNRAADGKTLTKTGAGTLKITTAYETPTVLSAGRVILPSDATAEVTSGVEGEDVKRTTNADSTVTYSLGDGLTPVAPGSPVEIEAATAEEAIAKATLEVDESIAPAFMLEAVREGETGPWTVSAVLNPEASVDGVPVRPTLVADDEEVEPMIVGETDVSLAVNTIPGLWYSVIASESLADDAVWAQVGDAVQATESQTVLTVGLGEGPCRFYRISVEGHGVPPNGGQD